MRGAQDGFVVVVGQVGIIPADAGSTRRCSTGIRHKEDHPRGCGEHDVRARASSLWPGSSPRMRGAPGLGVVGIHGKGIIPADAGSTQAFTSTTTSTKDHPRGCGEHSSCA